MSAQENTQYTIRLVSGRIVEPGPGGFYWFRHNGSGLGGSMNFDWAIHELAADSLGGVGVANRYGDQASVIEFIPRSSIESIVRVVDGCVCGNIKHINGGCMCGHHKGKPHCNGCNWCQGDKNAVMDESLYHCNGCNECQGEPR